MGISNAISAAVLLASLIFWPAAQTRAADALQEAESLLQKQQYDQAQVKLEGLVKMQAGNPQAWFDLGFAESHLGKTSESVAAYKKAVELSPKWFEASLNLGLALAKAGNVPEAASALRSAVQLKPTSGGQQALAKAWLSLAQVLEDSNPKEAFNAYAKVAELNPAKPEPVLAQGKLMERTGDLSGAEQQYLKAAGMGNTAAPERLINLYLKQKRLR